jgi:diaminopimelate decarboxylase
MTVAAATTEANDLRRSCQGVAPLPGRLEPWAADLLGDPARLAELVHLHGSPVNLLSTAPMERNGADLTRAAERVLRAQGKQGARVRR